MTQIKIYGGKKLKYKIIPCSEGDDELISGKLNTITDSKIDYEDAIEDELVVFKVTESGYNSTTGWPKATYQEVNTNCDKNGTGTYCGARIIQDGYTMDY